MKEILYKKNFEHFHTEFFKTSNQLLPLSEEDKSYHQKYPIFKTDFISSSEKDFEENFANPICSVYKHYYLYVLELDNHKLSFKIFTGSVGRRVGKAWFKKVKNVDYLTLNLEKGDFYEGSILGYNKKRNAFKKIRKNYFLSPTYKIFFKRLQESLNHSSDLSCNQNCLDLIRIISRILNPHSEVSDSLVLEDMVFKFYLEKKNVKFPNNYYVYKPFFFGPEFKKVLKKNKGKLVDAFMEFKVLNGKNLKKALHQVDHININLYRSLNDLFGDWLNQDFDFLKKNIILYESCFFSFRFQNFFRFHGLS